MPLTTNATKQRIVKKMVNQSLGALVQSLNNPDNPVAPGQQALNFLTDQVNLVGRDFGREIHDQLKYIAQQNKEHSAKIGQFLQGYGQVFLQEFAEIKQGVNDLQLRAQKKEETHKFNARIKGVTDALGLCNQLGQELKNKSLQKLATLGIAAVDLYSAGAGLIGMQALTLSAALGPACIIGMSLLTIHSLLKKKKGNNDVFAQVLMQNLQIISQQIEGLRNEMHAAFDHVFEGQKVIYDTLVDGFKQLSELIQRELQELNINVLQAATHLEISIARLSEVVVFGQQVQALHNFRTIINRMESYIRKANLGFKVNASNIERELVDLVGWIKFKGEFSVPLNNGEQKLVELHHGDPNECLNKVLPHVNSATVNDAIGYLAKYANQNITRLYVTEEKLPILVEEKDEKKANIREEKQREVKHDAAMIDIQQAEQLPPDAIRVDVDAIVNIEAWSAGVRCYIQAQARFAEHCPLDAEEITRITETGENMLLFIRSLQINPKLFEKLFSNYAQAVKKVIRIITDVIKVRNSEIEKRQEEAVMLVVQRLYPDEKTPDNAIAKINDLHNQEEKIDIRKRLNQVMAGKTPLTLISKVNYLYSSFISNDHYVQTGNDLVARTKFSLSGVEIRLPSEFILLEQLRLGYFETTCKATTVGSFAETDKTLIAKMDLDIHFKYFDANSSIHLKSITYEIPVEDTIDFYTYVKKRDSRRALHGKIDKPTYDLHFRCFDTYDQQYIGNITPDVNGIIESYWQRKKVKVIKENNTIDQLRLEANKKLAAYFLATRKNAIKDVFSSNNQVPLNAALNELDANLRLLKAYALLAGFRQNELEQLNKLWDATGIKKQLNDYFDNAQSLDIPLPMQTEVPAFADIKTLLLSKTNSNQADYFESLLCKSIAPILYSLELLQLESRFKQINSPPADYRSFKEAYFALKIMLHNGKYTAHTLNDMCRDMRNIEDLLREKEQGLRDQHMLRCAEAKNDNIAPHDSKYDGGDRNNGNSALINGNVAIKSSASIPNSSSSEESDKLIIAAKEYGFNCEDVDRDGNCVFHAIAKQLNVRHNAQYSFKELKNIAFEHIKLNKNKYGGFIDHEGIDTVHHIIALSFELSINIVVIRGDNKNPNIFKQNNAVNTVYIGYDGGHYQSLNDGNPNEGTQNSGAKHPDLIKLIENTKSIELKGIACVGKKPIDGIQQKQPQAIASGLQDHIKMLQSPTALMASDSPLNNKPVLPPAPKVMHKDEKKQLRPFRR